MELLKPEVKEMIKKRIGQGHSSKPLRSLGASLVIELNNSISGADRASGGDYFNLVIDYLDRENFKLCDVFRYGSAVFAYVKKRDSGKYYLLAMSDSYLGNHRIKVMKQQGRIDRLPGIKKILNIELN